MQPNSIERRECDRAITRGTTAEDYSAQVNQRDKP